MTIAQQLPSGLTEQEILVQGYEIMLKELGRKSANYYFYTDEDFPSDLVNEYFYINKMETV